MGATPLSTPSDDSRKIGGRKDGDGDVERQIDAHGDQREDDEDDGPREARSPVFSLRASSPRRAICRQSSSSSSVGSSRTDLDFGLVVEPQAAGHDHLLAFLHAAENLHVVALAHADRDYALVRLVVAAGHHHFVRARHRS